MRRSSILKGINVLLDGLNWDLVGLSSFSQEFWFVDPLGTTGDLFTSHEEIIRVGVVGVNWINHGIEGSGICGVSVKHVEISIILFQDQSTKDFLILSCQILEWVLHIFVFC